MLTQNSRPIPLKGCLVRISGNESVATVLDVRNHLGVAEICIRFQGGKAPIWRKLAECKSAFVVGMEVIESTRAKAQRERYQGTIIANRTIGGREQHLVDFVEVGFRQWTPFENLRLTRSVLSRFESNKKFGIGSAERFRLRNLAYAIDYWHQNTGALTHLKIDPLPHQIHLVHHILKSGNLNWLIADDVGLGKTIEVGMLISALNARQAADRILLVCPAGLVHQWKDEMRGKFGLDDFQIYGIDFFVNDVQDWKLHDRVIASLDLLKLEDHRAKVMQAAPWDLIVFDEAHRLGRSQYGMRFDTSDRYRLATNLRQRTQSLILLSATPHQGKPDKFQALLELLRPEWSSQIENISANPWILSRMVLRNNKADVTDADGNFIFKGKTVRTIVVDLDEGGRKFDKRLRDYLSCGYGAAGDRKTQKRRAIGFVMTVYRKLAASSIAAIESALVRRLDRLKIEKNETNHYADGSPEDNPYEGEWEEQAVGGMGEFFTGEISMLECLLEAAEEAHRTDSKIIAFMDGLAQDALKNNLNEKLLIFTEYRATQEYIAAALRKKYGGAAVALIHGSMNITEREEAIAVFEDGGQFLVSTEAGGEGINLQRHCHVMINYDLPWNPMRLFQRVGRLYRYGQSRRVVVFNIQTPATIDGKIVQIMYSRIQQVVADMAPMGGEFQQGLEDEVLGQVVDLLDVGAILEGAQTEGVGRTQRRIDDALQKAREGAELQRSLFEHFAGYDAKDSDCEFRLSQQHVKSFVVGLCKILDAPVVEETHKGSVVTVRLSEKMQRDLSSRRQTVRFTFDRTLANPRGDIVCADYESPIFRYLLETAKATDFDALTACLVGIECEALISSVLRWQSDSGQRMREEFCAVMVDAAGRVKVNADSFRRWLLSEAVDSSLQSGRNQTPMIIQSAQKAFDRRLAEVSSSELHPESRQVITAAWVS